MKEYKVLNNQSKIDGVFSIVPIRSIDQLDIMKWRNQQMFHLRQSTKLTKEAQASYFDNVVDKLFDQEKPSQILFSFLKNGKCIGYGGLVHINWLDKNTELSFIMNTDLEKNNFENYWTKFLNLIEKVAFIELEFHKIVTYAFDLRPHLYKVLERNGYQKESRLKEHCFFDGKFIDVVTHRKFRK